MKVLYLNNDGGGFADMSKSPKARRSRTSSPSGSRMASPQDYLIRVNRQPVAATRCCRRATE